MHHRLTPTLFVPAVSLLLAVGLMAPVAAGPEHDASVGCHEHPGPASSPMSVDASPVAEPGCASHHEHRHAGHGEHREAHEEAKAERREARDEAKAERREARDEAKAERRKDRSELPIDEIYTEAAADAIGVVRAGLGIAAPSSAPGEELGLWHYTIPAGVELATHTHPGWQLARVTAGELEYSVISGEGQLLRADGSIEPMGPGTYLLATGDGVIENPELVHFGANRTDEVVTIISATLLAAGEPVSTLVDATMNDTESSAEPEPVAAESPAA